MSDNTKDWANIRIEEPVRDDARDDPRTYTEIMRAGLNSEKSPAENVNMDFSDIDSAKFPGDVPDDLQERLDRIESSASTAEERTGSIQNTLESARLGR